jgi:antitoxin component of MazEF toxin-antitoxin module
MKPVELRVARIGNSRGVRIPAATLERYGIGDAVLMEERSDGILLRPAELKGRKLSWEETAREMAVAAEDWSEWETSAGDGLEEVPWAPASPRRVAEPASAPASKSASRKRRPER